MEKFVLSLLTSSLTMTAVAVIYMLFSKILREHWSAKWRYYTWVLIFAGFIMPYKPSFGNAVVNFNTHGQMVEIGNGFYSLPDRSFGIFQMMFIVWAVGAVLFIVKALTDQYMFIKSVKRLSRSVDVKTKKLIDNLTDELYIWQAVNAVKLKEISTPMIIGFFTPTIILPQRDFTEEELRLILKHELMHFKSKDLFIKAFMLLVRAVNWFNPFLKLFLRNAEQECEMYCDERVMTGETDYHKKLYCQSIINTASNAAEASTKLRPALSSNFNISREGLKQRLKTILSVKKKYKLGIICGAVAALIVLSGTVFAFSENNIYEGYVEVTNTPVVESFDTSYDDEEAVFTTFNAIYSEVTQNY